MNFLIKELVFYFITTKITIMFNPQLTNLISLHINDR